MLIRLHGYALRRAVAPIALVAGVVLGSMLGLAPAAAGGPTGALEALPAEPAEPRPPIDGIFIDAWYSDTNLYQRPYRAVSIREGIEVTSTDSNVTVAGVSTSATDPGRWYVEVTNGTFPVTLGRMPSARISGSTTTCGMRYYGWADVHELERAPDGTVTRFAASIFSSCGRVEGPFTHAEVRYRAQTGYQAYSIDPMPVLPVGLYGATVEFGDVMAGTASAPRTITVVNTGTEPIDVDATVAESTSPSFVVDAALCAHATLAEGESCAIAVTFAPDATAVGSAGGTIRIDLPDFMAANRTVTLHGVGTGTAVSTLAAAGSPPDAAYGGDFQFGIDTDPPAATGLATIEVVCEDGTHRVIIWVAPAGVRPQVAWMPLAPGTCTASLEIDGDNGWTISGDGPHVLDIPQFSDVTVALSTGGTLISGAPLRAGTVLEVEAAVAAANGGAPRGGTITIEDVSTGEMLGTGLVSPNVQDLAVATSPLAKGEHVFKATYSGDGETAGTYRTATVVVDGDPPVGNVVINDGEAATADPAVTLHLQASDAHSGVTMVRVADSPALDGDGVLVSGSTYDAFESVPWTIAGADGVHHVHVQWRDGVGLWSSPVRASIVLDRAGPVATAPVARLGPAGATMSGGRLPVRLRWTAVDATTSVARHDLHMATGSAGFTAAGSGTAAGAGFALAPDRAYRFGARGVDAVGNHGAWADAGPIHLAAVQQSAKRIRYDGAWAGASNPSWWGGSARTSGDAGATARITFTGRSFAWIGRTAPGYGRARVYVDGRPVATVDLGSTRRVDRAVIWSTTWAGSATHTIVVKVLGTPGRPRVAVDAFAWLP